VLIGRAQMPYEAELPPSLSQFAYLEAAVVDPSRDFNIHMERLIGNVERRIWAVLRGEDLKRRLSEISNQPSPNVDVFLEGLFGTYKKENELPESDRRFQSALWENFKLKSQYALLRDESKNLLEIGADVAEEQVNCYRAKIIDEMERVSAHQEEIRREVRDLGVHEKTLSLFD
jgi:hypothetical protein